MSDAKTETKNQTTSSGGDPRPLCIWHKGCLDGFTSAWVVNRYFQGEVEFYPGVYQEDPPDVTDRNVLMVDFSYKKPVIEEMIKEARAILILDHHKTAQADLAEFFVPSSKVEAFPYFPPEGDIAAFFDMERSGAGLCWDFFFPNQPMPRFIAHVQDRDLWKFKLTGTKEINAYAYAQNFDFAIFDRMVEGCDRQDSFGHMMMAGHTLELQRAKDCDTLIKNGKRMMKLGGIEMPVVNAPNFCASDIGHRLSATHDCKCGATYIDLSDGKRAWSLRSSEDGPNVSEIAKAMGGGGHVHAAGFTAPQDWEPEA